MPAVPPVQERAKERGAERPPHGVPAPPQSNDKPEKMNHRDDGGSPPRVDRSERQNERQTERAAPPRAERVAPPRVEQRGAAKPPADRDEKGPHNPKDAGDRP